MHDGAVKITKQFITHMDNGQSNCHPVTVTLKLSEIHNLRRQTGWP